MDKADRALQGGKQSDVDIIKGVIIRLQEFIDLINLTLSYLVSEYLNEKLQNVAWIGIENDFKDNFLDLQEALQQINYI
jgi:hypothetical protein